VIVTVQMGNMSKADRRRWIALAVVCLGQLMMVLDATIVNVALPSIQRDLHFSQANLTWIIDAYMIAFGSFLLFAGRLGDLIGRKRVFLSGLVLFTLASAACGISGDQVVLIAARFIQGLGGAIASSVILALIVTEFPQPRERAIAMSVYTFIISSGGSIGLLAGGVLTQAISWHWIFFVNVPIGIVTLVLGRRLIDETEGIGLGKGIDVLGSVLMTVAAMLGVYAIVKASNYGWGSARTLGVGAAALILLAGFVALESRIENPIFPLRILRLRGLTGSSVVRGFLVTGMFATFFLGALYLQHVRRYDAIHTGLAFLPMTLTLGALSAGITARVMRRFGAQRVLIAGMTAIVAALLLLSRANEHASYLPDIFVPFLLLGFGAGTSFLPLMTIAMEDVPVRDAGLASGIVNASLQVSAAIGIAVLGTLAAGRTRTLEHGGSTVVHALTGGYQLAFTIAAASVAVGAVVALTVLRPPRPPRESELPAELPANAATEVAEIAA
jgi:EmrB/QacA subfamily drug resistance transporter